MDDIDIDDWSWPRGEAAAAAAAAAAATAAACSAETVPVAVGTFVVGEAVTWRLGDETGGGTGGFVMSGFWSIDSPGRPILTVFEFGLNMPSCGGPTDCWTWKLTVLGCGRCIWRLCLPINWASLVVRSLCLLYRSIFASIKKVSFFRLWLPSSTLED